MLDFFSCISDFWYYLQFHKTPFQVVIGAATGVTPSEGSVLPYRGAAALCNFCSEPSMQQ